MIVPRRFRTCAVAAASEPGEFLTFDHDNPNGRCCSSVRGSGNVDRVSTRMPRQQLDSEVAVRFSPLGSRDGNHPIVRRPVHPELDALMAVGGKPLRNFAGVGDEWREQQELGVPALAVDRGEQQFQPQATRAGCQPMRLVHDDEGQRAADPVLPIATQHHVQLFGRRDEQAELPLGIRVNQHVGFKAVYLQGRAGLLDSDAKVSEVSPQTQSQLIDQRPRRCEICNPPALTVKLVQRLKNPKLSDERLAARCGQAHHDGAMPRAEQPLFTKRAPLWRQHLEDRLLAITRSHRFDEPQDAAVHGAGNCPDAVFDERTGSAGEQVHERFPLHKLSGGCGCDGPVELCF